MRRTLFTLAAGVSAVLCGLLVAGRIQAERSYRANVQSIPHSGYMIVHHSASEIRVFGAKVTTPIAIFITAVLPVVWVFLRVVGLVLRRKHAKDGLCPACGYDLRAT